MVAVGIERALLARFPEAGLGDRRSRHVRIGRTLGRSSHWDRSPSDIFVEDATGSAVKLIAAVTAVDGDAIAPLVREGLLTVLQQNYPAALPGGQ